MRSFAVILLFTLLLTCALRTEACFSEGVRQTKMADYKRRCEELGLKHKEIDCLLNEGNKYEPKTHVVHGGTYTCYHDEDYSRHMISAMSICVEELQSVSVRMAKSGLPKLVEPKMRPRAVRQSIEPTTPMRKVARWLGLKSTVRRDCSGGCLSGCHYCCINTGLAGDDICFRVYCRGQGYCT